MPAHSTSTAGQHFIEGFESCRLSAYLDMAGIPTIGWGHTGPDVHMGMTITQPHADELFEQDLKKFEEIVNREVHVPITQGEFDALVSFSYNVGGAALHSSTLLKDLNSADYAGADAQFQAWDRSAGRVVLGLLRRRQAEAALFKN
jgi:lysozyme